MTMISNTLSHFDGNIPDTCHLTHSFPRSKARFVVAIIYANYGFRFVYATIARVIANNVIDARVWYINIIVLPAGCYVSLCVSLGIASIHTSTLVWHLASSRDSSMNSVTAGQVIAVNHWQVCVDQLAPTVDTRQSVLYSTCSATPYPATAIPLHSTYNSKGIYLRIIFTGQFC